MGVVRGASHDEADALSRLAPQSSTSYNGLFSGGSCSWTAVGVSRLPGKVGDPKILAIISFLESLGVVLSIWFSSSSSGGRITSFSDCSSLCGSSVSKSS